MYQINPLPKQVSSEDLALLRQAEPATIGHFQSSGFLRADIRAHAVRVAAERAIAFQVQEQVTLARLRNGEKFPDIVGSRAVLDQAIAAAIAAQS